MKKALLLFSLIFFACGLKAQVKKRYIDSIKTYQKEYIDSHEVVKGKDRKYFRFFPISETNRVNCRFGKINDSVGFTMKTSAGTEKPFFRYGKLYFTLNGKACELVVYQSGGPLKDPKYKDYLFIPFFDETTGDESYGSGRYIDIITGDIVGTSLLLDFNKAYNPYCAYTTGFKCPIPPRENRLMVAVRAGEMSFGKSH